MSQFVFYLNKLHATAEGSAYEEFVRAIDYPRAHTISSIIDYRVVAVDSSLRNDDAPPANYVEIIQVKDVGSFLKELDARQDREEFVAQLRTHLASAVSFHGRLITPS